MDTSTIPSLTHSYHALCKALAKNPTLLQEVVKQCFQNIQANVHLNALVRTYKAEVQKKVKENIQRFQAGSARRLEGMVVGIKDLFCYANHPVQASSRILEGFVSQITATAVARCTHAGAMIIGHQNCDEFGMGSANENSVYGSVLNPLDNTRTPGGSSGGSAVAVKTGMCHVSLGTDTGGSVRQPAAFCDIIGFKPSYSRISRHGVIAYSSSFDTVGILANTIYDCALVLSVVAGEDKNDTTSARLGVPDYTADLDWKPKKLNIAYLEETLSHPNLQKEIKANTQRLLRKLKQAGHRVSSIPFPWLAYVLPTYYILTTAEASANLARYDGMRYGYRAKGDSPQAIMTNTRTLGFGHEVKKRLLLGAFVLSSDYYDSYYGQAQKVRRHIKHWMEKVFASYDYIILPTTPTTAFPHKSTNLASVTQYLADLYTTPASVAGVPAISIPNGYDGQGLPVGVQIISGPFQEGKLLQFAQYLLSDAQFLSS